MEVKGEDCVRRIRINTRDGSFYIHEDRKFKSVAQLVDHYTSYPAAVIAEKTLNLFPKYPLVVPPDALRGYVEFVSVQRSSKGICQLCCLLTEIKSNSKEL